MNNNMCKETDNFKNLAGEFDKMATDNNLEVEHLDLSKLNEISSKFSPEDSIKISKKYE